MKTLEILTAVALFLGATSATSVSSLSFKNLQFTIRILKLLDHIQFRKIYNGQLTQLLRKGYNIGIEQFTITYKQLHPHLANILPLHASLDSPCVAGSGDHRGRYGAGQEQQCRTLPIHGRIQGNPLCWRDRVIWEAQTTPWLGWWVQRSEAFVPNSDGSLANVPALVGESRELVHIPEKPTLFKKI